jgi:hypothetical protein
MMVDSAVEESVRRGLRAVYQITTDEALQDRLRDQQEANAALKKLGLPESDGVRADLLQIVGRIEQLKGQELAQPDAAPNQPSLQETRRMLLESFGHIRVAFWISLGMSIILFLVGLVLVVIAVSRFLRSDVSTATLTIAGLGMADFIVLFYTKPWKDVSANLSNSQRVRMIATSYLAGLSLLSEDRLDTVDRLGELTRSSIHLLGVLQTRRADREAGVEVDPS